jgi:hypothetical protein
MLEALPGSDQQKIVLTTDAATTRTYPFFPEITILVGDNAKADANAWIHCYFKDGPAANDFGTANAITVKDKNAVDVKGLVGGADKVFSFAYDTDTVGGSAGTDKLIVIEVEGNGIATASKSELLITRTQSLSVSCAPSLETNL